MVDDVSKRQAELITKVIAMGQGSFYESNPAEIIIPEPIVETKSQYVFNNNEDYTTADKEQLKSTSSQVSDVKPTTTTLLPWKHQSQPTSSLSPPPRQTKSKRDSNVSRKNSQFNNDSSNNNSRGGRRPLVDPTLTPRVKPRSIKTKKQPSLLRLSLDAELLQQTSSPDGVFSLQDNDSLSSCKAGHSSLSFTPTQSQPFRSGTLGATRNPKLSISTDHNDVPLPPLPTTTTTTTTTTTALNIPSVTTNTSHVNTNTRPNSQSTCATSNSNISYIADSPVSVSAVEAVAIDLEEEKLTLKERRHRKSPLSMPDTEQLTLALQSFQTEEPDEKKPLHPLQQQLRRRRQSQQIYYDNNNNNNDDELVWRQQILEQSLAFSFQNKSRHEAMLSLEGKHSKGTTTLQPIVNFHELDSHFENDSNDVQDVVKEKAQYDAVVSRTTMHRRQLSHDERKSTFNNNNNRTSLRARSPTESITTTNEKKMLQQSETMVSPAQQLGIITENEVATTTTTTPISANKKLLFTTTSGPHLTVTPETPPHHQQNAPSLISAPSTPNSIDSSVFDHDDYINHERHPHLSLILSSAP
ncbi:hypothetical protein EDC94DRAFT_699016 [Helicostylum pulchrum]|nr:hypothetical protein EDC94DRAFT_699016 [Helicostylum pulchrum]